ncbi:DUF5615 family PIN-like protein [Halomicronema hongdechloris]|uniref:DUF5615 family PIN-like protein n=1 Tax=Halomicronema hongdechloris TaxID=1209493 RepID=UPI001CED032E
MKLLLDSCVWGGAKLPLSEAGHDVVWAGDWDSDPGDAEILLTAYQEGRVLVTIDKDFGELAIVRGTPHCGIIRLVNWKARQQAIACLYQLQVSMRHSKSAYSEIRKCHGSSSQDCDRRKRRPPQKVPARSAYSEPKRTVANALLAQKWTD